MAGRSYKRNKKGQFASSSGFGGGVTRAMSRGVRSPKTRAAIKIAAVNIALGGSTRSTIGFAALAGAATPGRKS